MLEIVFLVRPFFADLALVAFLLAQVLDGAFTYVGVLHYGPGVEGNPLLVWLMSRMGEATTLTTVKLAASILGIALHLGAVHRAVALLAVMYVGGAVLPWLTILYLL